LGILLHRQDPEESGSVNATFDRLASLLRKHTPDRLASFWDDAMKQTPETLSDVIIRTIRDRGMTAYAAGKASGVDISIIQRFLAGERDLSLKNAEKVCDALDLHLVERESTHV
jgi:DNA-binding phage protein